MSNRQPVLVGGLLGLVLFGLPACAGNSAAPSSPAPTSAAAQPAVTTRASTYCAAVVDANTKARGLAARSNVSPADYLDMAATYEQMAPLAPAELRPDIATLAKSFRALAAGSTTVAAVGPELGKAGLHMTRVTVDVCPLPGG